MTIAAAERIERSGAPSAWTWIWAGAILAVGALYLVPDIAPWAARYPTEALIPFADWISAIMAWLKTNFTWLTRGITDILAIPLGWAFNLLAKGWKIGTPPDVLVLPRLSWVGIVASFTIAGFAFGGWRLGALAGGCLLYVALFGQWDSAMLTLALIAISVPLCIIVGIGLGIVSFKRDR